MIHIRESPEDEFFPSPPNLIFAPPAEAARFLAAVQDFAPRQRAVRFAFG